MSARLGEDRYAESGFAIVGIDGGITDIVARQEYMQFFSERGFGALDVRLSAEIIKRPDAVTGFDPGFPRNFIERSGSFVYGAVGKLGRSAAMTRQNNEVSG